MTRLAWPDYRHEIQHPRIYRESQHESVLQHSTHFNLFYPVTDAFGGEKSVQDALRGLGLTEVGQCLPGMEVSLLTHQIIGG